MDIKILGPGCHRCHDLEARTRQALADLGVDATVEAVTDVGEIAGYGLLQTPGLVVDGDLVVAGRVPTVRELARLLAA